MDVCLDDLAQLQTLGTGIWAWDINAVGYAWCVLLPLQHCCSPFGIKFHSCTGPLSLTGNMQGH